MQNFSHFFNLPSEAVYLNCAAQGPLTKAASAAVQQSIQDKEYPAVIDQNYGELLTLKAKQEVAKLLQCEIKNISLANSTSWGINTIVNGFNFLSGDNILLLAGQFPSNSSPWHSLQERGVTLTKLETSNYFFDLDKFETALKPSTKMVCLEWVHFVSGDRIPLKEIISICEKRNILTVLDATQGIGAIHYSYKEAPVDALICSAYKWLLSPYGSGFSVFSDRMLEQLKPSLINWLNFKNIQYSGRLADCSSEFCDTARKFDVFSYMGFMNLSGMIASLELLNSLDINKNYDYVRSLISQIESKLNPEFYQPLNTQKDKNRHSLISTFTCNYLNPEALINELKQKNITASIRQGFLRISPFIYNNSQQVSYLTDFLNSFSSGTSKTRPSTASV